MTVKELIKVLQELDDKCINYEVYFDGWEIEEKHLRINDYWEMVELA